MKKMALIFFLGLMMISMIRLYDSVMANDEAVPLLKGCNALAWTGSDDTSAQTIVDLVKFPQAVISSWKFDPETGDWLGFAPFGPVGANDLFSIDRFGVVFLCVNDETWWYRPVLEDSTIS